MKIDHIRDLAAQLYADRMRQDGAFLSREAPRQAHQQHARAAIVEAFAFVEAWGRRIDSMTKEEP